MNNPKNQDAYENGGETLISIEYSDDGSNPMLYGDGVSEPIDPIVMETIESVLGENNVYLPEILDMPQP